MQNPCTEQHLSSFSGDSPPKWRFSAIPACFVAVWEEFWQTQSAKSDLVAETMRSLYSKLTIEHAYSHNQP